MIDRDRIQAAFSSIHWLFTRYESQSDEPSVIKLLTKELRHINPESWPERLAFGGVFINGIGYYEDIELPEICKIEYYEPRFNLSEVHLQYPPFSSNWIVWDDTDIIVVSKPGGLPAMAGKEQRNYNLKTYLELHLKKTLHFPSRLDMSTEGLVIASKTDRMHGPLQRLFEKRQIVKEYIFQTTGDPTFESIIVDAPIGKCLEHPVLRTPFGVNAKKAVTKLDFLTRAPLDESSLPTSFFLAQPFTGRTHQIRVHAAHMNLPIIGDNFYGGLPASPLRLLSFRLSFEHPFTQSHCAIVIPHHLLPLWALPGLQSMGSPA